METRISTPVQSAAGPAVFSNISWPRPKYLLFGFIGLMYAYVLWNNERFLFNPNDPEWPHIESFKWWLLPHGLTAACALFLGPLQFSDRLRKRFAKVHRVVGRFYVAGVFIGAPLGIYIQYVEERMGATRNFTIAAGADAALWIFSTVMALIFIFVEVRAIIGITGWGRFAEIIVWCCVAAAIPLADFVLQLEELHRTRRVPARAGRLAPQASAVAGQ